MKAYLVLGCNGNSDKEDFIYCSSCSNPIIDLAKVKKENYDKLMEFLDNSCSLFDRPCFDYNKTVNIINFLYKNFSIISEEKLHKIQAFIRMHRSCGIYIMLIMKEDYNE